MLWPRSGFNVNLQSTMILSKSNIGKILAASTLLAGGVALWIWTRRRRQHRALVQLDFLRKSTVHVVETAEEWEQCVPQLALGAEKVLGLDCEWVLKRRVALLQIASPSRCCILVRLCCMDASSLPQSLKTVLADRSILKVGVAVNDDAKKLMRDYGLLVKGCVDLRHMLQRLPRGIYKCHSWGLQGLAKSVLNVNLSKDFKVRCGNWEAVHLNTRQINYAAMDAIVAVDIFTHLVLAKATGLDPRLCPQSASTVPVEKFLSTSRSLCQGIMDAHYVRKTDPNKLKGRPVKTTGKKLNGAAYSTRKRPLWDNCELLAPDGQPLCTCDIRKAAWYISKGLGDKVSEDPLVVKLRFEPSGRPKSERNYYLQQKENSCVVCGTTEGYARKFVVPQEYRKYFPHVLKEHTSHDVLLMCPPCHRRCSDHDGLLRAELAQECNAPLNSGDNSSVYQDHDLQQVKSAGRALKLNRHKIPEARIQQLEKILFDFYGVPEITADVVEQAATLDIKQVKENYVSHGQRVVEHMLATSSLLEFQARWRRHFVRTMKPQFLPAYWSVDYVPENWDVAASDDSVGEEEEEEEEEKGEEREEEEEKEEEREEEEEEVEFEGEEEDGSESVEEAESDEEEGGR